jgi:hypothetical protein
MSGECWQRRDRLSRLAQGGGSINTIAPQVVIEGGILAEKLVVNEGATPERSRTATRKPAPCNPFILISCA